MANRLEEAEQRIVRLMEAGFTRSEAVVEYVNSLPGDTISYAEVEDYNEQQRANGHDKSAEEIPALFRTLAEIISNPTRPAWLIRDVLEESVVALLTGPRGTFKSFIAMHWLLTIATEGRPVLAVSAEGAGLDRRLRAWLRHYAPERDPESIPFLALDRRVDFNNVDSLMRITDEIANQPTPPVALLIDTVSKNSGALDEDSNSEVKVFVGNLDTLIRRRFGCAVVMVHHTGHAELKRARGASAWEADTDAAYICSRTVGTQFVQVTRERFKDSPELMPLSYEAKVQELDGTDEEGRPMSSLVIVPSNPDAVAAETKPKEPRGGQQKQLLRILKRLQTETTDSELVWTIEEMRRLGRDAGMDRATVRDAAATLCQHYMRASVGGYRLLKRGES